MFHLSLSVFTSDLMETNQFMTLHVLTLSLGFKGEVEAHHLVCLCLCCCVGEGDASGAGERDSEPDRASRSSAAALSADHQHSCVGRWTG